MMPVLFKDLQEKQFISICSTSLEGKPHETKHHGKIKPPKVAEQYLQMAAVVDINNHVRIGSPGLEMSGLPKTIFTNNLLEFLVFHSAISFWQQHTPP